MNFYELGSATWPICNSKLLLQTGSSSDPQQFDSGMHGRQGGGVQTQLFSLELVPTLPLTVTGGAWLRTTPQTQGQQSRQLSCRREAAGLEEGGRCRRGVPAAPQLLLLAVAMLECGPCPVTRLAFKKSLKS